MRFLKGSAILPALVLVLCNSNLVWAAQQQISGRFVFDNSGFACDTQCVVTLLASGVRPIQTVMADFSGRFTFNSAPSGIYTIRLEIDGVETLTQQVDTRDGINDLTIMVPVPRKSTVPSGGSDIVDVSEFLGRYPKKAVSFFEKGSESLKKKKNDEAIKYLQNAVELAPTFYQAHNELGIAYRETGRADDAEREFMKAHELNSTGVEPLLNLTKLYLDEDDTDRAVQTGEQAVKANSHSAPAFLTFGIALYKAAQLDRAEAALRRALDLAPKMGSVRLMLANVYLKLRKYDNTLEQLNHYIAENPKGQQIQEAVQMRDQLLTTGMVERP